MIVETWEEEWEYEWVVFGTIHHVIRYDYMDRDQFRGRQAYVYGEFLRGIRREYYTYDEEGEWTEKRREWISRRIEHRLGPDPFEVEIPCPEPPKDPVLPPIAPPEDDDDLEPLPQPGGGPRPPPVVPGPRGPFSR